jgi:hypothetical protein
MKIAKLLLIMMTAMTVMESTQASRPMSIKPPTISIEQAPVTYETVLPKHAKLVAGNESRSEFYILGEKAYEAKPSAAPVQIASNEKVTEAERISNIKFALEKVSDDNVVEKKLAKLASQVPANKLANPIVKTKLASHKAPRLANSKTKTVKLARHTPAKLVNLKAVKLARHASPKLAHHKIAKLNRHKIVKLANSAPKQNHGRYKTSVLVVKA